MIDIEIRKNLVWNSASARRWVRFGVIAGSIAAGSLQAQSSSWPMFGQNVANTANAGSETAISARNAFRLKPKWTFTTGGDVSVRAAVVNGVAYFPDWAGNLFAVNAANGTLLWSHQISDYGLPAGTVSRTTPAYSGGILYVGTQTGGWLLAITAANGSLHWKMQPDNSGPSPMITTSPVVSGGYVYLGMTANEENLAGFQPGYPCCLTRGSVVAVNASTGQRLWRTYTVPIGYTGGAVWGSNPVVDVARNTLFVGTGNNYSTPTAPDYVSCVAAGGTEPSCLAANDYIDSIVAFDLNTGIVKWGTRLTQWGQTGITDGADSWNVSCFVSPFSDCPTPTGPDYDFGSAPNEITYSGPGGSATIIGAGQKSGIYYALDPDTGAELWHTQVGPGSSLGGIEWGSASDGKRIYVAISDYFAIPYAAGSAGSWAALNPATGAIEWQVPDPNAAIDLGSVSVANGVVYAESMAGATTAPNMFALNAATGATLWDFASGASVIAGATIVDGVVFWGSGYAHLGIPGFTGNNKFYAFSTN